MTVTEVPRDEAVAEATKTEPAPPGGLAALVGTGDPRSIGKLFVGTSLVFLLGVATAGVLVGIDRVDTSSADILGGDLAQVATFHQIGGLFLVLLPLLLGIAHAVVPLQVGASTVAFPRASAVAYWVYLVSGGLMIAGFIDNGGPFGGDADSVGLFVVGFVALIVALCVATISIASTVLALRAPGMTLRRIPLFSWSMMVAGTIWLLTLPVLAGLLVLFHVDTTYGDGGLFQFGSSQLYDQIRWVFWQPALYAFAIPALGIISDIVPVFAQRRLFKHSTALVFVGLFGILSFGSWAQLLISGEGRSAIVPEVAAVDPGAITWLHDNPVWSTMSALALLPVLGLLGLWTVTLFTGRIRPTGVLGLAIIAGLLLAIGVAMGIGTAIPETDLFGTTWTSGQSYAVLVATLVAGVAGLVFWAPKLYGRSVRDSVAKLVAPLALVGGLLVTVGYAVAGVLHQPWLLESFIDHGNEVTETDAVELLNVVAVAGIGVLLLAGVLVILGLLTAGPAEDDPWNGHTLEWATASPPPAGNFAEVPEITSEAPIYDRRHAEASATGALAAGKEVSA